MKIAANLPKMGRFRAKNSKNGHFWPVLTDFLSFFCDVARVRGLGMWLAVRGRLKPEQQTANTPFRRVVRVVKSVGYLIRPEA
ncbi:MAG: hypothetical protein EOM20_11845 [Spartobacteria bacterium]|nr:hypothetical protein [Spartobacteria bacterium]